MGRCCKWVWRWALKLAGLEVCERCGCGMIWQGLYWQCPECRAVCEDE